MEKSNYLLIDASYETYEYHEFQPNNVSDKKANFYERLWDVTINSSKDEHIMIFECLRN